MTAVLIALADVGPAVQLEEQLNQAGIKARWDITQADGPLGGNSAAVVLVDADHLGAKLAAVSALWRDQPNVPGVVALGSSTVARAQAPVARTTLVAPTAKITTLVAAIHEAAKLRLASDMRWPVLRAAVGLPPVPDAPIAWQSTLAAARKVDLEIPRSALRWKVAHYATPTTRLAELREERLLTVPELEAAAKLDGTTTVKRLVNAGPLDPQQTARFLWTLGSMGALEFTPEVRDLATGPRRMLHDMRTHLRARSRRLERSTFYDVLELTPQAEYPEIEDAYRLVGLRYAPNVLAEYDLSELQPEIQPMWELVEKARSVLVDHAARGRYHDWLREKLPALRTVWAIDASMVSAAATAFARGQAALGAGDVHKAMSELAVACRKFPGQPEYEANFAWARYRVQVASGRDRVEAAVAERQAVEDLMMGCRPWPKALVALSLLCAASGDADAARWHLHIALQTDPTVPAAAQLAQRLGMRRY
ncbi:MAG: J domain-containing protein [Myxococcales bacterium]|nr:J domain-containing protein [Myxococcales bacterium]